MDLNAKLAKIQTVKGQESTFTIEKGKIPAELELSEREEELLKLVSDISLHIATEDWLGNPRPEAPWQKKSSFVLVKEKGKILILSAYVINPYLLCHLYDVLNEFKGSGFARECRSCERESSWRMAQVREGRADRRALPAPKGGIIPFSGAIRRVCDNLALNITRNILPSLKQRIEEENPEVVRIPLYAEANAFSFEEDMRSLWKKSKKEKKPKTKKKEEEPKEINFELSKVSICPYSGKELNDVKQIDLDHILSRGHQKNQIFNSEVNLIPCDSNANQEKGDHFYSLEELNSEHLKAVFGELYDPKNIQSIKTFIKNQLAPYLQDEKGKALKYYSTFKRLEERDKRAFRYGLFCIQDPAFEQERNYLIGVVLTTVYRSRVNGTQRYLLQSLKNCIERGLRSVLKDRKIYFSMDAVDPNDYRKNWLQPDRSFKNVIKDARGVMAEQKEEYIKKGSQKPISHIIDAYLIYHLGHFIRKSEKRYEGFNSFSDLLKDPENLQTLLNGIPDSYRTINPESTSLTSLKKDIKSKPLFNANFYRERLLPLVVTKEGLGFGFSFKEKEWFISSSKGFKSPLYALVYPYLKEKVKVRLPDPLNENRNSYPPTPVVCAFDTVKVLDFLTEIYHKPAHERTKDENQTEKILSSLLYRTTREMLEVGESNMSKLFNPDPKKGGSDFIIAMDQGKEEEEFKFKLKIPMEKINSKEAFPFIYKEVSFLLPAWENWKRLSQYYHQASLKNPKIQESEGSQEEDKNTLYQQKGKALFEAIKLLKKDFVRKDKKEDGNWVPRPRAQHSPRGGKLSLPVLTNEGSVRIHRRDHTGKRTFYQLMKQDAAKVKGFRYDQNEKGEWEKTLIPVLTSKNLSSFKPKKSYYVSLPEKGGATINMKSDWVILYLLASDKDCFIQRCSLSYSDDARISVILRISRNHLFWRNLAEFLKEETNFSLEGIPETLEIKDKKRNEDLFKFLNSHISQSFFGSLELEEFQLSSARNDQPKIILKVINNTKDFVDLEYVGGVSISHHEVIRQVVQEKYEGRSSVYWKVGKKEDCLS